MSQQPPSRLRLPLLLPVLPEEMIFEILYRVPVRFLPRFKCVCKSWKALISSPRFKKGYFRTSFSVTSMTHQRLVCVVIDAGRRLTTCSLQSLFENPLARPETSSFRFEPRWIYMIGSCNGLVCLSDDYGRFKLRNPFTTLACKISPRIDTNRDNVMKDEITHYGFGYDRVNDKYKVLVTYGGFSKLITKVLTFGAKTWKTIQAFPSCARPQVHWDNVGMFVSGTLNWLVMKTNHTIISFDLEKETYGEVLLPRHTESDLLPCNLSVMSKWLCLCYSNDIHCVMWLMKKYSIQESWTKLIVIPRSKIPTYARAPPIRLRLLCISENGIALVESNIPAFFMYNTKNGELNYYPKFMGEYRHYIHIYQESLVSPHRSSFSILP